jgi:hypothetical protein
MIPIDLWIFLFGHCGVGNVVVIWWMVDGGWWMVDGGWWMVNGERCLFSCRNVYCFFAFLCTDGNEITYLSRSVNLNQSISINQSMYP